MSISNAHRKLKSKEPAAATFDPRTPQPFPPHYSNPMMNSLPAGESQLKRKQKRPGSAKIKCATVTSPVRLPQMGGSFYAPMPMMAPMASMQSLGFSDMQTATSNAQLEDRNKRLEAKIEILERKIKAKDQLFEDSLSSSFAGCAASSGAEYTVLIQKLKKRVLMLQACNEQAESEIKRLTKTVRVVEVEVREENEPLHAEIRSLKEELLRIQLENSSLKE